MAVVVGCRKAGKERKESRKGAGKGVGKDVKEMNTRGRKDGWAEKDRKGRGEGGARTWQK